MAMRTGPGKYATKLPEHIFYPLVLGFLLLREITWQQLEADASLWPDEDVLTLLNHVEQEVGSNLPGLLGIVILSSGGAPTPLTKRIVERQVLLNVVAGQVIEVDTIEFLRNHPDILKLWRDESDCQGECQHEECVLHPVHYQEWDEDVPDAFKDAINKLFEDDED